MAQTLQRSRLLILAPGMLALLAAMWAGLVRLGWALPPLTQTLAVSHGPLMVSGFLGTLIGLERAVAFGQRWGYIGPVLTAIGGVGLVAGAPPRVAAMLMTLGSAVVTAVLAAIIRRQNALFAWTIALGSLLWAVGNALWLAGLPLAVVVNWWAAYLVLTIAGERLELSRVLLLPAGGRNLFLAVTGVLLAGLVVSVGIPDLGVRVIGAGLLALAVWLWRYDVARRTVRQTGLTRFIAVCLLTGYAWLAVAALLALRWGGAMAGPYYDAMLHAVFLGFVFAMIFGHAPVIFPAVLGLAVPYRTAFYAHLGLLQVSLLLRLAGDLGGWYAARQWGGLLNVFALLLFLANTVLSVRAGRMST